MDPEDTVDYNIRKAWYNITRMYNESASEYMASTSLAMIALNIDLAEGTPSTELGPNMGMEPTSLSRSLRKLEAIGVIERKIDPSDKRKSIIHLTPLGRKHRKIAKDIVIEFNEKVQSYFEKEDMDVFFNVLRKINKITKAKK